MTSLARKTESSDAAWIERISDRDESALVEVIENYAPQIRGICLRICRDELDADDVVSSVFWELWNRSFNYNSRRGSLRTYLLTLARSRAIDRHRAVAARQRQTEKFMNTQAGSVSSAAVEEPVQRAMNSEREQKVREALALLPESQQTALQLAFFDGLTHREVAAQQALPLGTVKTNIRRGLLQLREFLAEAPAARRTV